MIPAQTGGIVVGAGQTEAAAQKLGTVAKLGTSVSTTVLLMH